MNTFRRFGRRVSDPQLLRWCALILLGLAVLLQFAPPVLRTRFELVIDYNEGWNAYHTEAVIAGQPLYDSRNEWTPVDYPPLSFYVIGFLSRLLGDPIFVGRYVALGSLLLVAVGVGRAVWRLGGEIYEAVFAGIFCLGLFVAYASYYVGMNDPQMMGHLLMTAGLLVYLRRPFAKGQLLLVALLCVLAVFIKYNLLAIPITLTIDILIRSRRDFLKWIGYLALMLGCLVLISYMVWGAEYVRQSALSLVTYNINKAIRAGGSMGTNLLIPLIAVTPWVVRAVRSDRTRVIAIYLLISGAFGLYTAGGSGTDVNMFFDLFIGLAVAVGMALTSVRGLFACLPKWGQQWLFPLLPIIVSLGLFARVPQNRIRSSTYGEFKQREQALLADVAFLKAHPGPTICETILLCYYAGKPFEYDPYNAGEMMLKGIKPEAQIVNRLESGYYSVVQLNNPLPDKYLDEAPYTAEPERPIELGVRFTENFKLALGSHYILERRTGKRSFYLPMPTLSHEGRLKAVAG